MKKQAIKTNLLGSVKRQLLQAALALCVIALVWVVAHFIVGNELLLPDFFACAKESVLLLGKQSFWDSFLATLVRVLSAFLIALVMAAALGFLAYRFTWLYRFFAPFIALLRSLPTLAVLLIILVWSGAAVAPVTVAVMSLFPMLYTALTSALFEVQDDLKEMSRVYNVPVKTQILQLYAPAVAPYVIREGGGALAFSLKLVVSAEVLAGTYRSLGGMMQDAKLYVEMPTLFALVILTFLVGLLFEFIAALLAEAAERRLR